MYLIQSCPGARTEDLFVGRAAERGQIHEFADKAVGGQAWAVLLEGSAGMGKTALLRHAAPSAARFRVIRATGDRGEVSLPFSLISQMLLRARCHLASARSVADELAAGEPAARIGARLLDIVYAAQDRQPLAMIIDDLQWADPQSTEALGYLLRRLDTERVLVLLSARTQHRTPGEWAAGRGSYWRRLIDDRQFGRRIRLVGLTPEEVAEMAAGFGHGMIPLTTAERLRQYTGGNPASLRALLTELPDDRLNRADCPLPVPGPLAAQVGGLLATLPAASRSLLEALTVLDTRCPLGLAARVAGLADPVTALEPLLDSEIVRWWPEEPATPVQVRLPAQRQAVYQLLTPRRRRELHLAAAAVVPEEAKWAHRVASAGRVDGGLARELELAAARALRDGAAERAATMLLWSADLTGDRSAHERRLLAAAAELIWSQAFGRAEALRPRLAECAPSPLRDLILLALSPDDGGAAAVSALADVLAGVLADGDPGLAELAARVALVVARGHVSMGDGRVEDAVARLVLAAGDIDPDIQTIAGCLLAGTPHRVHGGAGDAAEPHADRVTAPYAAERPGDATLLWRRAVRRARAGQLSGAAGDLSAALRLNRARDELDVAANMALAYIQYLLGSWEAAAATAEQAIVLALHRGATWSYTSAHAIAACVAASSGTLAAAEEQLRTSRRWCRSSGRASDVLYPAIAGATLAQARGDHPAMLAALTPLSAVLRGFTGRRYHEWCWWWPLQVEALIGTGRLDEAERALAPFTAAAAATPCLRAGSAWLSGWLAHRRGDLDVARSSYSDALGGEIPPGGDDIPLLRARLEHGYGHLLLAQRDRKTAVRWLRSARERYRALGAAPFLARCDADLSGCGLAAGPGAGANVLSRQEDRVARLVAQGMTNEEVARQLYVSAKTVEFHLSNIFAKLGITSRRQLRHGALAAEPLHA